MSRALTNCRRAALVGWRSLVQPRVVLQSGVRLPLTEQVSRRVRKYIYAGVYESGEAEGIRHVLTPDDVVIELGTGIGFISTLVAQRIGSDRVFSFEANPALESTIRQTYELNGVNPSIEFCLLGAEEGEETFYLYDSFWASSTIPKEGARAVRVPVKPVNDVIRRINPTMLILDIEGGEAELIPLIDFRTISKIAIELHPRRIGEDKMKEIQKRFDDLGFRPVWSAREGLNLILVREVNEGAPAGVPAEPAVGVQRDSPSELL